MDIHAAESSSRFNLNYYNLMVTNKNLYESFNINVAHMEFDSLY